MRLGIFAKTFPGDIETNLAAVAAAQIPAVQYNLSIAGIDTVPAAIPEGTLPQIAAAATANHVDLAAISGTFNAAHPDPKVRAEAIRKFPVLAAAARDLGIPVITLSSGSRDPQDMWKYHPDNATAQAWADSRDTLVQLAEIAETTGVVIAIEPEHTNVVSDAALGRKMLEEVGSNHLKIVFDAANLLDTDDLSTDTIHRVIDHALDVLGPDIALAHAKELVTDRAPVAPGEGVLPWRHITAKLVQVGYQGTLVMHGLPASGVPHAVQTLTPLLEGTD